MTCVVHGFVDGAYLREVAIGSGYACYPNPRDLVAAAARTSLVESWAGGTLLESRVRVTRVTFYDAQPDDPVDDVRERHWNAVELLNDTHLGFGFLRGEGRRVRQKAVDTLIAVDMLVGAFTRIYDIAILVTGDADFVPVVAEVRRRGGAVMLVASSDGLSAELLRAADRYIRISSGLVIGGEAHLPSEVLLNQMDGFPLPRRSGR